MGSIAEVLIRAPIQRSKQNDAGHDHIYILQNMDSPDAPRIKEIESLAASKIPTVWHHEKVVSL